MPGEDVGTWGEKDWVPGCSCPLLLRAVISLACWLLLLNSGCLVSFPAPPSWRVRLGEMLLGDEKVSQWETALDSTEPA